MALGLFADRPDLLRNAANYLEADYSNNPDYPE